MEENGCPEGMLGSYLYESFQLLEQMEAIMLEQGGEGILNADSINEMFRIVHTLKGTAGIMMYDNIAYAAHKLEDIFYYLRESGSEDILKAQLSEYVFRVSDFIAGELNKIKDGGMPDGDTGDIVKHIEIYLTSMKEEIRGRGVELPPENIYAPPTQYYVAPAAEKKDMLPIKIDLGAEPADEPEMQPGDYVIEGSSIRKDNLVGVSMEKLEKLTVLVERLAGAQKQLENKPDSKERLKKLKAISSELEELVKQMRQAPLSGLFRKMNRVVYDAPRRLSKEIELRTEGGQLMADRGLLDGMSEALMHMVRNAADHGIESLAQRRRAGKPDKGKILLKAWQEDGILTLSVEDDGRGLDRQLIFECARLKGLIAPDAQPEAYSEQEIYTLITLPGFSTRDEVTELSGRGVGMDVALNRVKELGGSLRIESTLGEGTRISAVFPVD